MMASQTRTMAAWALAALLLCASFELSESVKKSLFRKIGNALFCTQNVRPAYCDSECEKCGQNKNLYDSTIVIVSPIKNENVDFGFGTMIGKRLALTNPKRLWLFFTKNLKLYGVYLSSNGAFSYSVRYGITDIKKVKKNTDDDGIVLLVLDKDIPILTVPACLPMSELKITEGMEFDVPFYEEKTRFVKDTDGENGFTIMNVDEKNVQSNQLKVELPLKLVNRKLKVIGEANPKGRLLTLNYDNLNKPRNTVLWAAHGAPVSEHRVDGYNIPRGMLAWKDLNAPKDLDLHIVAIDDDEVVKWIHERAGKNCACNEPNPEVTPTTHKQG